MNPATAEAVQAEQDFSAGWKGEEPKATPPAEPAPEPTPDESTTQGEAQPTDTPSGEAEQGAQGESPSQPAAPAKDPDYKTLFAKTEHERRSVLGMFRKERERNAELERQLAEERAARERERAEREAARNQMTEDDEAIELLRREMPTVAEAVEKIIERRVPKASQQGESTPTPARPAQPAVVSPETDQDAALRAHYESISKGHADWQTVVNSPEFLAWVTNGLPDWQRGRAQEVLEAGTAPEVVSLLDDFKRAHGIAVHRQQSQQDEARRRAREAGGSVRSGPTAPVAVGAARDDANDFNAGWKLSR